MATSSKLTEKKRKQRIAPEKVPQNENAFVKLEWERQPVERPTNRQRALLGIAVGLILAWWAALAWLVWDSLS